jgi:hypothetical protein
LSTRIERDFSFQAGVHFEGSFIMNIYNLTLAMEVETESITEQNIAMDRIIYFLEDSLANSVFVQTSDKKAIEKYTQADIKVCTVPEEPYDQIITMLLILKLNNITEGRLNITDIFLESELSDSVRFSYDIETARHNPFGNKGWWLETSTSMNNIEKNTKKEKIVRLVKHNDWANVGLEWEKKTKASEILFTNESDKLP